MKRSFQKKSFERESKLKICKRETEQDGNNRLRKMSHQGKERPWEEIDEV
jgi:hypothetical protein